MEVKGRLRKIAKDDLEMILEWRNSPSVSEAMYTQHQISKEEHLAWWDRVKSRTDEAHFIFESNGNPSGVANLKEINSEAGTCVFGIYTSPDAVRGTGSAILALLCDHVFTTLKLDTLLCEALASNEKAIALYRRFGFEYVEAFQRADPTQVGEIEAVRFALDAGSWRQRSMA